MMRVTEVKVVGEYRLDLTFDDGTRGTADLSDLVGKGVFSLWCDHDAFAGVRIGTSGELVWGDQVDLCPDALYLKVTGKRLEDLATGETPVKYKIALLKTDEGFSVSVPGLPGCWSQGATEEEALTNIKDAIREYLAAREELLKGALIREIEVAA